MLPNVVWGAGLVALVAAFRNLPHQILLAPMLALPTVGIYQVAALMVRQEPVSMADGFTSWRQFGCRRSRAGCGAPGLCRGVHDQPCHGHPEQRRGRLVPGHLRGLGLVRGLRDSDRIGRPGRFLVDPWRASLGLRDVLRLAALLAITFPVRFSALAACLVLFVVVSTFAIIVLLTMAIGITALIASRYVLAAADRFAPA